MADKTVCELKYFLYLSLLCGFYHDLHPSHRIRLLSKLYCLALLGMVTISLCFFIGVYPWYTVYPLYSEYASQVLFSLWNKHKFILNYYQYLPCVDGIATPKKFIYLSRVINMLIPVVFLVELIYYTILYRTDLDQYIKLDMIVVVSIAAAIQLKRLSIVLTYMLFYYRVNTMRQLLEINGFANTPRRRLQPQRYIQIYESLMDGLEKTNTYVQLSWFLYLSCLLPPMLCDLFVLILEMQQSAKSVLSLVWLILAYTIELEAVIISAVLSDLIRDNLQKMMIGIVDKRLTSNNERERADIDKLYQLMQIRPYAYTLAGVLPLELHSLLSIFSYLITTIIAILQIKRSV